MMIQFASALSSPLMGDPDPDTKPSMAQALHPLRQYRRERELTTKALSGVLGIAPSTIRSIENGTRRVTAELALVIEKKTGIARASLRPDLW